MIKFFRKIRYDLMEKNKTGMYFKYAIGEIILVVIGILIALSINNWNESKKESIIRNNYYEQILQDLTKDIIYINRQIEHLNSSISSYTNYTETLKNKESIDEIINEFMKLDWEFAYLNFNTNTIESLISTGDIKLMPDVIRNRLLDLKNTQNNLIKVTSGNDAVYLNSNRKALGLGGINYILELHPNLTNSLYRTEDKIDVLNLLNESFQLKNYTELGLSISLKSILESIDKLSELINEEIKK
ncbi:MAG: DUF6090 family protein [Psychroserpens sp.]|uniref:DUF6090 family protein n=1 Tax=Psychroserpens sp. TaxID=2020870 RepID=UPI00300154BD